MVASVIGVLPLIKRPKFSYPDITQPWYADDAEAPGMFSSLEFFFFAWPPARSV